MMGDITIIDASAVIHHGDTSTQTAGANHKGLPVGGIVELLRRVSLALGQGELVAVCFDSKTSRKDLFPNYKAGRTRNTRVIAQLELAKTLLENANVCCLKVEGYEADDIIDWVVRENPNTPRITILGNDEDLAHSVAPNTTLRLFGVANKIVSKNSFERTMNLPYNTVSIHKVFRGCNSDKIPVFKGVKKINSQIMYDRCVDFINENNYYDNFYATTSLSLITSFIMQAKDLFGEEDLPELDKRIKLIYPFDKPEGLVIQPTALADVNVDALSELASALYEMPVIKGIRGKLKKGKTYTTDLLDQRARNYTSGAFMVDNNLSFSSPELASSEVLSIKSF